MQHFCFISRLAASKPIQAESDWSAVNEALFGKDGLVPDVMNSVEWRAKLWAIQQDAA